MDDGKQIMDKDSDRIKVRLLPSVRMSPKARRRGLVMAALTLGLEMSGAMVPKAHAINLAELGNRAMNVVLNETQRSIEHRREAEREKRYQEEEARRFAAEQEREREQERIEREAEERRCAAEQGQAVQVAAAQPTAAPRRRRGCE